MTPDPTPYDALLLVSFGGPERPEDVVGDVDPVGRPVAPGGEHDRLAAGQPLAGLLHLARPRDAGASAAR